MKKRSLLIVLLVVFAFACSNDKKPNPTQKKSNQTHQPTVLLPLTNKMNAFGYC
jgi:hypothetical protein